MNGRGDCCIARHTVGGGGGIYRMSKVDRIMQKFRPIAPKPVAAGSGSGGSTTENSDGYVKCRRGKRKYVKVNGNKKKDDNLKRRRNENKKVASSSSPTHLSTKRDAVVSPVTLSLLPESPDRKQNLPVAGFADLLSSVHTNMCKCNNNKKSAPAPVWLSFNNKEEKVCYGDVGGFHPMVVKPPPPPQRVQVVSYVTVESVTDMWVDGEGFGCTDEERVMKMEKDTCPGFISDSRDRVVWTNKAFKQMVGYGQVIGGEDMSVVLVRKDKWTPSPVTNPAFTCKVRITSVSHSHDTTSSPSSPTRTLPCDVWRMERDACAWRLDVKAALSLGR